ncbi:MAG: hypothetical protein KA807_15690 [Prolixibacteraceae bacterium]|nr:hypothetical protein [Prolixibacteraceae bacterium]
MNNINKKNEELDDLVKQRLQGELTIIREREKQIKKSLEKKKVKSVLNIKKGSKRFHIDKQDLKDIGKFGLTVVSGAIAAYGTTAIGLVPGGWWTPLVGIAGAIIVEGAKKYLSDNQKEITANEK